MNDTLSLSLNCIIYTVFACLPAPEIEVFDYNGYYDKKLMLSVIIFLCGSMRL